MNHFRKIYSVLWLAGFSVAFTACKTASTVATKPTEKVKTLQPEEYLAQKINFRTFSGKADLSLVKDDQNQNFSANIRMHKDKDIWSSLMVLGIAEVARAYITPDSLQALVRIGKKAYALSYEEGLKLIQAQVPFPVLQNLIIGNPLMDSAKMVKVERQDSTIRITQQQKDFTQVLTYQETTRLLQKLSLSADQKDFKCTIDFSDYRPLALKQPFAYSRHIQIHNNEADILLDIDFNKAEVDVPVLMNFSIPASYTLVNLKN